MPITSRLALFVLLTTAWTLAVLRLVRLPVDGPAPLIGGTVAWVAGCAALALACGPRSPVGAADGTVVAVATLLGVAALLSLLVEPTQPLADLGAIVVGVALGFVRSGARRHVPGP